MKLENQVCTLEQAKRLKELGISQESFFTWYGGFGGSPIPPYVDLTDQTNYDASVNGYYGHPDRTYAAYTSSELGIMLPVLEMTFTDDHEMWHALTACTSPTMAHALAAILIIRLEQKDIPATLCNARLQSA